MRLYLIRHPRPDYPDQVCYGATDLDAPFDQALLAQLMVSLPRKLPHQVPHEIPLFSSPLKRCAALADALAPLLDCAPPIQDARLAEMNFGDWEMRSWHDVPRNEVDAWTSDLTGYRPGNGENVLEVAQRVRAFRDDVMKLKLDQAIVVCHAGTIRLLLAGECGLPLAATALMATQSAHRIGYGEVIVLTCVPTA